MKHEIAELLPFYVNGTLDVADRTRVEAELARCETCRADLHELEAIAAALREREAEAASIDAIFAATSARIDAAHMAPSPPSAWWTWPARYAVAAALVLAFGGVAVAAWHARYGGGIASESHGQAVTVVRMPTPPPTAAVIAQQPKIKINTATARVPQGAPAPAESAAPHRLARTAKIALLVRSTDTTIAALRGEAQRAGGALAGLDDDNPRDAGAVHTAAATLEVPSPALDATLDRIAQLGTVTNRSLAAEDVETAIVDQEARLTSLRRAEADLRRIMDRGGKTSDVLEAQQQLSETRGQIERLVAEHRANVHRTVTATIQVSLSEEQRQPASAKPGPTARIDGAWRAGLGALADTIVGWISGAVWFAAISPLLLAPLSVATLAAYAVRRRAATR